MRSTSPSPAVASLLIPAPAGRRPGDEHSPKTPKSLSPNFALCPQSTDSKYVCFACGLNPDGTAKLRVTRWPGSVLNQEPGCGALYQPYGPVELSHTVSLNSELAIDAILGEIPEARHRVWACRLQFLHSCGGQWTQEWLNSSSYRMEGGYVVDREWARDPVCRVCGVHP